MWTKVFTLYPHFAGQCCCYHWRPDQHPPFLKAIFVFPSEFWHFHVSDPFGKYPILPVTVISALCVFFSRTLMHWLRFGSWNPQSYFPEMFFYLVYGVLFSSTAVK